MGSLLFPALGPVEPDDRLNRTGRMHLWWMAADGANEEQLTTDEFNNWFPHPSPDGKTLVFLTYAADVKGHPENKDVTLRRMNLADRKIDVLGRFFGGQVTVNVPCFAPDGKQIAFVTYQMVLCRSASVRLRSGARRPPGGQFGGQLLDGRRAD